MSEPKGPSREARKYTIRDTGNPEASSIIGRQGCVFCLFICVSVLWGWSLYFRSHSFIVCSETKNIYTVDAAYPRVECISVVGSRIVDVGSYAEVQPRHNPLVKLIHLILISGSTNSLFWKPILYRINADFVVVPGLADAHAHIIENGYMMQLPLKGCNSPQDVVNQIKTYILSHPDVRDDKSRWIEGMGWDHTKWPGGEFPTAADLDCEPLLKGRLIALSRIDGHARWVSQAVLDILGELPKEVNGGIIVRDEEGKPTGIFIDNAMDLLPIPPWTEAQMAEYFNLTITEALSYGLTSIHDADTSLERIEFFKKLADAGKLPIRLYLMGYIESDEYWGNQIPRLIDYGKDQRLNLRSVKIFADGQ